MDKIGNIARRIAKGILAKPVLTQEALDAMGSQTCPVLLCEISGFSVDEKTGETKWDGKYSLSFRYGDKREFKGIVKEVAGENILMLPPFKGTTDDFEMMSPNFTVYYPNDKNTRKFYFNIVPESEADADGPYENLIIVVQDFNKDVWNSLIWVIMGGSVFMLIIVAAFYITLRTILNQKKLSAILA